MTSSSQTNNGAVALNIASQLLAKVHAAPFLFGNQQVTSVVIITVAAGLSTLAVLLLLFHMAVTTIAHICRRSKNNANSRVFVTTHLGIYIVSLLISALLQGIGVVLELFWGARRGITEGMLCTAQAVVLQIGNLGTAFFTLLITAHTFNAIVLRKRVPRWILILSTLFVWAVVLFFGLVAPKLISKKELGPFYGRSGLWCWITPSYTTSQAGLQYLPILVVISICIILYLGILVTIRGALFQRLRSIGGKQFQGNPATDDDGTENTFIIAKYLFWYPVVYLLVSSPLAISGLLQMASHIVPFGATIFSIIMYSLMGLAYVIVYVTTHRVCGKPWRMAIASETLQGSENKIVAESFVALEKQPTPPSPARWEPTTKEWTPPITARTPRSSIISTRRPLSLASTRASVYSGIDVLDRPVPPVPLIITDSDSASEITVWRAPSHRRLRSDSTLVDRRPSIHSFNASLIGQPIAPAGEITIDMPLAPPPAATAASTSRSGLRTDLRRTDSMAALALAVEDRSDSPTPSLPPPPRKRNTPSPTLSQRRESYIEDDEPLVRPMSIDFVVPSPVLAALSRKDEAAARHDSIITYYTRESPLSPSPGPSNTIPRVRFAESVSEETDDGYGQLVPSGKYVRPSVSAVAMNTNLGRNPSAAPSLRTQRSIERGKSIAGEHPRNLRRVGSGSKGSSNQEE